ncbi:hypothetical protein GQ55_7G086000 [Panicum hallii var. hallii]|uniref:Uncharacterized protein n=1 Tax=Panicum hallii var. hallii TaxID=1504633 RepID=A0A2T7CT39_9POAL|nr:hypothetical protein GQ55_7G086000 [Panicum hallii var. hallii]
MGSRRPHRSRSQFPYPMLRPSASTMPPMSSSPQITDEAAIFCPPRSVAPWFGQSVDEVVGNQIELSLGDVTRGQHVASYSITTLLATSSVLRRRMPAAALDREPESVVRPEEQDDDDDDQSGV